MTLDLEEVTAKEAYSRMRWCEETVKQLRERTLRKARVWWEKECTRPAWLECLPRSRETILQLADRLEAEMYQWAEAASTLAAKERKEKRRVLERALSDKQGLLARVRQCQAIPESERMGRDSELRWACGHAYLMEKLRGVRKNNSYVFESYPIRLYKIGHTQRTWKKRSNELYREGYTSKARYATVVPFQLEQALHAHYDHFRVRRAERQKGQRKNIRGERFRLPQEEIERFKEVVSRVECWVLVAVEARLELEIMRMEAALSRVQQ
jgi:hypothetical protein